MKTKNKTIKSILGCTVACSAVLLGGIGAASFNNEKINTQAVFVDNIPVSLSNPNFNKNTSSSYPFSPNDYSAYNQGVKVDSSASSDSNINAGVINLSNEDYETRFSLAKRTSLDNYVLMIDSTDKDDHSIMHNANYGFQTNSAISLDKNSKYMITVDVFTATNGNIASLFLFDNNGNVFSSIEKVNSYNSWTTYSFFVATNNYETVSLKVGMYLDGAGTVLFDNISANKLSEAQYNFSLNSSTAGTFAEKQKADNVIENYKINSQGELVSNSSQTSNFNQIAFELNSKSSISYPKDSDGKNEYALMINNSESTYAQYETEDLFSFEANRVYQVSVNVKTKDLNGTASLQLVRTDIDKDDSEYSEDHNKTINITTNTYSSTTQSVTNDYSTYSFYIVSHPTKATTYKLVFGLGSSDALTSGKMFLSNIEVSKINYETYSSASENKISLVDEYSGSSIMLDNGDFNSIKIADYNSPIPATPSAWEVKLGSSTQHFGVVNTKTFESDLSELNDLNLKNPSAEQNNNVLMMYNSAKDTLSYTSASKNLTAKSYHKFDLEVQTHNSNVTLALVTKKDDKEIVLLEKTVQTSGVWQNVTLFVRSGYQDLDVSLKVTLNTTGAGYAYVDNAKFDWLLTQTQLENQFNVAENASFTAKTDLTNILSTSSSEKFASTNLFSQPTTLGVESGFVTFNASYLDEVIDGTDNLETFNFIANNQTNKKAIGIWSTEDVNYTLTSNVGFAVKSGSYYKISFDVFTQKLDSNNSEVDDELLGAGIGLTEFENSFVSVKSNNEWSTYTIYLKPEANKTTYLQLSLGSAEALTKGCVFFTNIAFDDTITEEDFNAVIESETTKIFTSATTSTEEEDKEETENKNSSESQTNWLFIIPSLLTVLALLIAIVGFLMRKIKFKNPFKKKSKTSYDRNKTVSVQYYTRKATTLREEKVRELTNDLEKVSSERKQYEDQYKQGMTKLREMKIKRANPADIAKLEKELKKNQKMSSTLGVTANKIADDLKYCKTEMYLNSLIKKLSREGANNSEETSENK